MSPISAIRVCRADLPLRISLEHASASEPVLQEIFLAVETTAGGFGLAEVRGNGAYATGTDTARALREVTGSLTSALRGVHLAKAPERIAALPVSTLVKALADSAVLDAAAREAGQPLWQFLGGEAKGAIPTHSQIGFCALEDAVVRAEEAARQGFCRVKVRIGRPRPEDDIAIVEALRGALGDAVAIVVDANGIWDAETAIRVLRAIEDSDIAWAEQPTPPGDNGAMRMVRRATGIPIVADEAARTAADIDRLSRLQAIDGVHLKLEKAGMVGELMRLAHDAREAGLKVFLGQMDQGRLGSAVTTHLAASISADAYELWGFQNVARDVASGLEIEDGRMVVPTGPGIGVDVDMSRLTEVGELV
jgi:L-alanine-DL-glutamate epimerase-like enolase superfamily enzyme